MANATLDSNLVPPGKSFNLIGFLEKYGVLVFLLLLIVVFAAYNPRFLSTRNITNILTEVSIYGIIGVGMTYVILAAGIDLSVGSLVAVQCCVCHFLFLPVLERLSGLDRLCMHVMIAYAQCHTRHQLFFSRFCSRQYPGNLSLPESDDVVTDCHHFGQFR